MAMGSIELGTVSRAQDYTIIKHNEDAKGLTDQTNGFLQVQKNENKKTKEVHLSENTQLYTKNPDAREKGKNEYNGDGGKQRKDRSKDCVIIKGKNTGFDIRI